MNLLDCILIDSVRSVTLNVLLYLYIVIYISSHSLRIYARHPICNDLVPFTLLYRKHKKLLFATYKKIIEREQSKIARNSLHYVILWLETSVSNVQGYCTNTDNEIKPKRVENSLIFLYT